MRRLLLIVGLGCALALIFSLSGGEPKTVSSTSAPSPVADPPRREPAVPTNPPKSVATPTPAPTPAPERAKSEDATLQESSRLIQAGQTAKAVALLESALGNDPENPQLLTELGFIYARLLNQDGKAREYFERALSDHPENGEALADLVEIYKRQNATTDGAAFLSQALTRHPENENTYLALADVLNGDGRAGEAAVYLEKAAGLPGAHSDGVDELLAKTYLQAGEPDKAVASYDRLIARKKGDPAAAADVKQLQMARISALTEGSDLEKAESEARRMLAQAGDDLETRSRLQGLMGEIQRRRK